MSCVKRCVASALAVGVILAWSNAHAQGGPPALDVPFVPTPQSVVERLLSLARVTKDDFVIDLGSGDGRIVITAAQKFGARGLGVDLDPQRIKEAGENLKRAGVGDRVEFRQQNLFEADLSQATVLTMYLLPRLNIQLRPMLLDLKPGTRLASHAFDMGDWRPDRHDRVEGRDAYFWVVPAKVGGRWQIDDGGTRIELELSQQYQEIHGTARIGDSTVVLRETSLNGDEIRFVIELEPGKPRAFRGRVSGNRIEALPAAEPAAAAGSWRASRS